jgi:hypothetical protein
VGIEEIKTRKPVPGQNNKRNSFKKPTINDYYKKKVDYSRAYVRAVC